MTEEKGRPEWLTEASLLLAVLFLGTNPVAVKVAVSEVPPLPFVAMRFTLAGPCYSLLCSYWGWTDRV
jgi:drug/metabolite transporter (DMT)-like permease